jgi:ribosomal protein S18 acetylase RimI-like enzyme
VTTVTYTNELTDDLVLDAAAFFEGWPRRPDTARFAAVLRGSYAVELVVDADGNVVGFVNAISDGVLTAFIPWLEVLPSHRSRGIGEELMRRVLAALDGMYSVDLTCDPPLISYYARLGLAPLAGMARRNPHNLTAST